MDALKEEIGRCTEKLSASEEAVQREGAAQLHSAMLDIWSLGAGELSRREADIACDEIRCVGHMDYPLAQYGHRYNIYGLALGGLRD